ncbi:MAG: hypothetical protein ACTTIS_00150 [Streptobacillus sp.]
MKVVEILGVNYEVEDHFNWLVKDVDGVVWVVAKRPIWLEDYKTWIPDGFGDMKILYAPDQPIDQQATLTKI